MSSAESVDPAGSLAPTDPEQIDDPQPPSNLVKPDPFVRGLGKDPAPE
jgi:hypothetical protein